MPFWLAEAPSLFRLDVSVPEVRKKKDRSLLTILDLPKVCYKSDGFVFASNIKYMEIFRTAEPMALSKSALSATFFHDYERISLEKLEANMDRNGMKRFLKHLRNYVYFVKKYFHPVYYCEVSGDLKIAEDISLFYFEESLKLGLAHRLIKLLFDNLCSDCSLIAEVLHTICVSRKIEAKLLFEIEPEMTEYILFHLKKADCDARSYWMRKLFPKFEVQHLIRKRPNNLLVLLNYGFTHVYRPFGNLWLIGYLYWTSDEETPNPYSRVIRHPLLPTVRDDHTQRELFILEVFEMFYEFISGQIYVSIEPETLVIIWRSIPDAYISFGEMRNVLLEDTSNREFVENMCDLFEECEVEGFISIPEPRSLKHLSRCAIRSALVLSCQLPEGIEQLGLPRQMQSYLRLEF